MVFSIRISSWKSKIKTLISILSNQYEFISTLPLGIFSKIINPVYFNLFPLVDISVGLSKFKMYRWALLKFQVKTRNARLAFHSFLIFLCMSFILQYIVQVLFISLSCYCIMLINFLFCIFVKIIFLENKWIRN